MHLDMSTLKGPELHLDLFGQEEHVLPLDVSTPQGPELHFNVLWTTGAFAAPGRVYTTRARAAPGRTYVDYRSQCATHRGTKPGNFSPGDFALLTAVSTPAAAQPARDQQAADRLDL
jgi:hypothetical protein